VWCGMASAKWLTRIQAVREPFQGYWQTSDYGSWDFLDGEPVRRALAEMKLKAAIARPREWPELKGCAFPSRLSARLPRTRLRSRLMACIVF
jgi:DMSO/TMAO reductase YedYZ molybdopterin-dependent catalytic subunit